MVIRETEWTTLGGAPRFTASNVMIVRISALVGCAARDAREGKGDSYRVIQQMIARISASVGERRERRKRKQRHGCGAARDAREGKGDSYRVIQQMIARISASGRRCGERRERRKRKQRQSHTTKH